MEYMVSNTNSKTVETGKCQITYEYRILWLQLYSTKYIWDIMQNFSDSLLILKILCVYYLFKKKSTKNEATDMELMCYPTDNTDWSAHIPRKRKETNIENLPHAMHFHV